MRSRTLTICLLSVLVALVVLASGCSSGEGLRPNSDDGKALRHIYNSSPWQFQQSLLEIQVREAGAVEINFEGDVIRKDTGKDGPLLLPVALVRELPDYLKGTDLKRQQAVELQSYKVVDGLWCITALLPPDESPEQASTHQPAQTPYKPNRTQLRVLLVSPAFSKNLPLLVPVERHRAGAEIYVTLPQGATFNSLNISNGNEPSEEDTKLTVLPTSLTGGMVRAAGKFSQESGMTWNFSGVTYTSPSNLNYFGKVPAYLLMAALICLFLAFFYWMQVKGVRRYKKDIGTSRLKRSEEIYELYRQLTEKEASAQSLDSELGVHEISMEREFHDTYHELKNVRHKLYERLGMLNIEMYRGGDSKEVEEVKGEEKKFSELLAKLRVKLNTPDGESQETDRIASWLRIQQELLGVINLFTLRLSHFKQLDEFEYKNRERVNPRERLILLMVMYAVMFLLAASMLVLTSKAQETPPSVQGEPQSQVATLGDFGMVATPKDAPSDKVAVALDFIALTNPSPQNIGEVGIGTGNRSDAEMQEVKAEPADRVKILQLSRKLARLMVPASSVPSLDASGLLSNPQLKIERVSMTDSLQAALNDKGNLVKLEYVVTRAQETKNYIGSWLHRFPFEYKTVTLPLNVQQPAIISKIELPRSSDFTGVVSAKGIYDAEFKESSNAYGLDLGRRESRITIPAGGEILLEATLRRTWFQRLFLTVGQIILAIIGGWILGFVASLGSESRTATIIGGIGLVGLPYLMRSSVLSTYKDLPSLLSGQTPTVFELVFLLSLAIFIYVAFRTRKNRRNKPSTI